MRIIFCLCTIILLFNANIANAMTSTEYVDALEQKLFGETYKNQNIQSRIDRIEMQIYDNNYAGSPEERLAKIDKIYPQAEFEINTHENSNNYSSSGWYNQDYPEPEEKSNYNNYPIISEIEENIYHKNFQGEDIYKRLSRLENELYGNEKNDQSLQERVESLKSVLPKKHYNRFAANDFGFKDFGLQQPSEYVSQNNFDTEQIVKELEIETFNKTYNNEKISKRIERLENFYFGGASMGQSNEERVSKIASVVMNTHNMKNYFPDNKGAQWAGILMNLLMIGLGFLL